MKSLTLYYKDDHADKVYTATIDGDMLTLAWGRRGAAMQSQTVGPLPEAELEKVFAKKIAEKLQKGYRPGNDIPLSVSVPSDLAARAAAPKPMLLNEIGDAELLRLAADPDWWMQEKHDGWRILLEKRGAKLTAYSRTGRDTIALPKPVADAALQCGYDFVIDGEIIGETVFTFDVLEMGMPRVSGDTRAYPYSKRLGLLNQLFEHSERGIVMVKTATEPDAKLEMFARVRAAGGEGVVLKDSTATYQTGRPSAGGVALKYKFVATASVIVAGPNGTKRSVVMQMVDGTIVGSVTIPPNVKQIPSAGQIIEVRYLTAHRGGSLTQPVFLMVRDDIGPEECTLDQLQFKSEAR